MAARGLLTAAALLALCTLALAQPCIECKNCGGSNHCLANCKRECPKPQAQVDINKCKLWGMEAGLKVAREACDNTRTYCNGGQKPAAYGRKVTVSLGQCANIAYGACQNRAGEHYKWWGECHGPLRWGQKQCNKDQFNSWYTGEVDSRCNTAVAWIDEKKP